MTIRFAPKAEADFAAVIGYLAERNPVAAQDFGERIFALIEIVRSWPVPPVRIYYRRQADAFWVLRIYHQAQPPITK